MQIKLFEKNSNIQNSTIYIAYLMLKKAQSSKNKERLSIFKLLGIVRSIEPDCNAKQFMYGLMLLNLLGIVKFNKPYIEFNHVETN